MTDLWIEDWYAYKEARSTLDNAMTVALKAGMTKTEICDYVSGQLNCGQLNCRDESQEETPPVAQEEGSVSGLEEQAQDKTPAEILDIVDAWLEDNSPDNVQIFSWQVVYAETWARVKAWRDKQ